jgi:hypothetical protein
LKAANNGVKQAQNNLGTMYSKGHGVTKNDVEAMKWYLKAAEQNDMYAQYNLGNQYYDMEDIASYKVALNWYLKAASNGYDKAQYKLGQMYLKGLGTEKNQSEAIKWLKKAALQGNRDAQDILENLGY